MVWPMVELNAGMARLAIAAEMPSVWFRVVAVATGSMISSVSLSSFVRVRGLCRVGIPPEGFEVEACP